MTFPPELFTSAEDGFLHSLASALAAAIERAFELQLTDAATQRTALLAEASMTLSRSLDLETTMAEVGRLLVPRFADWCALHLVRDGRAVSWSSMKHLKLAPEDAARSCSVFGRVKQSVSLHPSGHTVLVEMDGVRIISNSKCEFLQVRRSSRARRCRAPRCSRILTARKRKRLSNR
jgi:hypothetical protein